MIVLPAGIYHRFTLDENNYIKVFLVLVVFSTLMPMLRPDACEEATGQAEDVRDGLPALPDNGDVHLKFA
jgi:hypothetical protein